LKYLDIEWLVHKLTPRASVDLAASLASTYHTPPSTPAMTSTPCSKAEDLPIVWLESTKNLRYLTYSVGIEPVSITIRATLASLIIFLFMVMHIGQSGVCVLHQEGGINGSIDDAQAAIEDIAATGPIAARASEEQPANPAPLPSNHTYGSSVCSFEEYRPEPVTHINTDDVPA
jgi:hypothetical protein